MSGTTAVVDDRLSALGLVRMGLPMAGAMAATLAGHFAVLAILARAGGDALYLRAVYVPLSLIYSAIMAGLSMSMQAAAAREIGAGNPAGVGRYLTGFLVSGLTVSATLGVALTAGGSAVASLVGVGAADEPAFRAFVMAMAPAMLFPVAGEVLAAALRGTGATGLGSAASLTYPAIEIAGVYLLTTVFGWGLMAVPAAVCVAGAAQCGLGVLLCHRRDIRMGRWMQPSAVGGLFLRIGAPVAISYVVLFALNLGYVRILAPFGPETVAGFSLVYTLQTLIVVPGIGFGSAIAIVMNQARAAGRPERAWQALRLGMGATATGYLLIVLAVVLGGHALLGGLAADPTVAEEARRAFGVIAPTWAFMGCTLTAVAVMEETGSGVAALAGNLLWTGAVLAVGWALTSEAASPVPLYQTMAVANVIGLTVGVPLGLLLLKRTGRPERGKGDDR